MNELELLNGTEEIIPENIITKEQFVKFVENSVKFEELMMMYRCAIREVQTKLEILNDEFKTKRQRNPIDSIRSRIKSPLSIYEKLKRRNYPVSIQSIADNLNDVAGIRVVCPFISDIYDVARMLISQDDVEVMEVKDYIKNPKPNGYRSLHYVVIIPIFLSSGKEYMKVEVQIRTINFFSLSTSNLFAKTINSLKIAFSKQIKNLSTGFQTDCCISLRKRNRNYRCTIKITLKLFD